MLLEAGGPAPNVTILGAGAPVTAVVWVSLACFGITALITLYPFIKRWAERPASPALPTGPVPRVEVILDEATVRKIVRELLDEHFDRTHDDVRKIVSQELGPLVRIAESTHAAAGKVEAWAADLQKVFATGIERQSTTSRLVEEIARKQNDQSLTLTEISATVNHLDGGSTKPGRR